MSGLWETVGMTKSPKLIKISETVYGCSECVDFRIEMVKPSAKSQAEWDRRNGQHFLEHLKQRHSSEDASQTAARIVREATEGR